MKGISLFWKVWLMSISTIFITVMSCFLLFFLVIPGINYYTSEQKFDQVMQEIVMHTEKNGVDDWFLRDYQDQGYYMEIIIDNEYQYEITTQIVYSSAVEYIRNDEYYQTFIQSETSSIGRGDTEVIYTKDFWPGMYNVKTMQGSYNGEKFTINMIDVVGARGSLYALDISGYYSQNMLVSAAVYTLVFGIIVATILSLLIARIITQKIKRVNTTVHAMENFEVEELVTYPKGDELTQLENQIYRMYGKLRKTIAKLDEEVTYNKKLESEKHFLMQGATHELKTPIMAMSAMIEGMIENVGSYQDREIYLERCYQTLQKMQLLVNEILELSKLDAIQATGETKLLPVIEELQQLYSQLDESVVFQLHDMSGGQATMQMSEKNVHKVISNLLSNAIKYRQPQTPITITLSNDAFRITNTIPAGQRIDVVSIFKPFVNDATTNQDGHGLGLYITQVLLERYMIHFDCIVDSEAQTFTFEILLLTQANESEK